MGPAGEAIKLHVGERVNTWSGGWRVRAQLVLAGGHVRDKHEREAPTHCLLPSLTSRNFQKTQVDRDVLGATFHPCTGDGLGIGRAPRQKIIATSVHTGQKETESFPE